MTLKVKEEQTVVTEGIKAILPKIDFADTFSTTNHTHTIAEITNLIFNTTPSWVKALFTIRNRIVGLFGLTTKPPADYNTEYRVGGYIGFFKIYALANNQVILGANDTHLNFRAVVKNSDQTFGNIKVITLVEYNNKKGKIYMQLIKPFHKLVVKRMVKNAYVVKP